VADQSYQLVVRKGPRPGHVFPLTLDTITIGRDPLSDIVLNDPEISRHHAKVVRMGDGYELQDMGSTNGSFVDGKRMGGDPVSLRPGQVVMLGSNVTLIYQATSASDPMATMIAPTGMAGLEKPEPVSEPEPEPEPVPEIVTSPEMRIDEAMQEPEPEPEPIYEPPMPEPEPEPEPMMDEDIGMPTMMEPSFKAMEPEPTPMPRYEEPEPMPKYREPEPLSSFDSGAPLPDFDAQPAATPPPPPPPMGGTAEKQGGMSRNTMIIIAVIVILCCCCLLILAAYYAYSSDLLAGLDSVVPLITNPPVA
jgi:predicted component of type VI protein secretion system